MSFCVHKNKLFLVNFELKYTMHNLGKPSPLESSK